MINLKAGDWVEVRSKEEILQTLDAQGRLEGMPFMPEMLAFCGRRFQVYKSAHKACDTVFPIRVRRIESAVHLETRCDGGAHGGCQAGCLLYWKEAWLKPVGGPDSLVRVDVGRRSENGQKGCTEQELEIANQRTDKDGAPIYTCQATLLPEASSDLKWWEPGQYIEDYRSGNTSLWEMVRASIYLLYYHLSEAGIGLGPVMRWFYDRFCGLWGGKGFPRHNGLIPLGKQAPLESLELQPGEMVRVKSLPEIRATMDTNNKNRGLRFDAEMVPYCGETYRVLSRVNRIIDERSGKMIDIKNPCIVLENVFCRSRYSECRMFCPRSIHIYWREIWLERINPVTIMREIEEKPTQSNVKVSI